MMRPIPGQPGLFRDERRTALSDFSVPPPATGYTWDVPRGRPWVLGEIPQSLRDQARANAQRLASLKTAADPLVREVPWRTDAYSSLVRRVTTSPRGAILQITRADLGLLAGEFSGGSDGFFMRCSTCSTAARSAPSSVTAYRSWASPRLKPMARCSTLPLELIVFTRKKHDDTAG